MVSLTDRLDADAAGSVARLPVAAAERTVQHRGLAAAEPTEPALLGRPEQLRPQVQAPLQLGLGYSSQRRHSWEPVSGPRPEAAG